MEGKFVNYRRLNQVIIKQIAGILQGGGFKATPSEVLNYIKNHEKQIKVMYMRDFGFSELETDKTYANLRTHQTDIVKSPSLQELIDRNWEFGKERRVRLITTENR